LNRDLEQLIELSNFDKEISSFEPQIELEKSRLQEARKVADTIASNIAKHSEEIEVIKSKRSKNEIHLSELKDKLEDVAKKNKSVQTEKELKALQLEEEIAKEQVGFTHEEIVRLDEALTKKEELLAELEESLKTEEESLVDIDKEVNDAIKKLESDKVKSESTKDKLIKKIDEKVLNFYNKIRRWAGDSAIVPMKKQACYGCYMKVNDTVYSNVVKAFEINTCPHCGRIIYKEDESCE
jgi:predicted  nucleic acid-binding Zn-ribbon protein